MNAAVAAFPQTQSAPLTAPAATPLFGDRATRIRVYQPSADDDTAVLQTLDAMAAICRRTSSSPEVQAAARAAIAGIDVQQARRAELATAVWTWVRSHVLFAQDDDLWSGARELLIEPPLLLSMDQPTGDCDDFTMLLAAMLMSLGVPMQFVVIAADPRNPGRLSHVYAAAELENGAWFALDASHGQYAGWQAPHSFRHVTWFVASAVADSSIWLAAVLALGALAWWAFGGRS